MIKENLRQVLYSKKLEFIKCGIKNPIISVILGELERKVDKRTTTTEIENKEVINICKKLKTSNEEIIASIDPTENQQRASEFENILNETKYIEDFLNEYGPKEIPITMLHDLVKNYIWQHPNCKMGDIMKYFKFNYDGQYNGSLLSDIIKNYL